MSQDLIKLFPASFHTVMTLMTSPTVTSSSLFPFNLSQDFGTFVITGWLKQTLSMWFLPPLMSTNVPFLGGLEALNVKWIVYNN